MCVLGGLCICSVTCVKLVALVVFFLENLVLKLGGEVCSIDFERFEI